MMTTRTYKTIIVILLLAVCILLGIVVHYQFIEPERPVWKDLIMSDSSATDTTKPQPHK